MSEKAEPRDRWSEDTIKVGNELFYIKLGKPQIFTWSVGRDPNVWSTNPDLDAMMQAREVGS